MAQLLSNLDKVKSYVLAPESELSAKKAPPFTPAVLLVKLLRRKY